MGVVAFVVVALSSWMAGASSTSTVSRGVAAFVGFGVFGLVALRGVVYRVISELAKQAEEKRLQEKESRQVKKKPDAPSPLPE